MPVNSCRHKKLPASVKNSDSSNSPLLNIELMKHNSIFSETFTPIISLVHFALFKFFPQDIF